MSEQKSKSILLTKWIRVWYECLECGGGCITSSDWDAKSQVPKSPPECIYKAKDGRVASFREMDRKEYDPEKKEEEKFLALVCIECGWKTGIAPQTITKATAKEYCCPHCGRGPFKAIFGMAEKDLVNPNGPGWEKCPWPKTQVSQGCIKIQKAFLCPAECPNKIEKKL